MPTKDEKADRVVRRIEGILPPESMPVQTGSLLQVYLLVDEHHDPDSSLEAIKEIAGANHVRIDQDKKTCRVEVDLEC